jgi:D-3-phosphoglycerate dehydrogenase
VRGTLPGGGATSVSGTLVGLRQVEKIVEIDGYDVDLVPSGHMVFFRYDDRPGVVGVVGRILGEESINIAGMQVARDAAGGRALVALTVDSAIDAGVLERISTEIGADGARAVSFPV